nr:platelet glycoprotein V [Nerophis lumbriciformis]
MEQPPLVSAIPYTFLESVQQPTQLRYGQNMSTILTVLRQMEAIKMVKISKGLEALRDDLELEKEIAVNLADKPRKRGEQLVVILVFSTLTLFNCNTACPTTCVCSPTNIVECRGDTIIDTPKQLPNQMHTLRLSMTNMNVIGEQSLEKKELMFHFSLTFSQLHTIHPRAFYAAPQLTSVELSYNNLASLPEGVFRPLIVLEHLHLNRNHLETITADMFEGLAKLKDLDLSYNKFSIIPPGTFSKLINLEALNIGKNRFRTLPPTIFHSLSKLERLSIYKNQLESLEPELFTRLVNLKYLHIYSNKLTAIPPEVFWKLVNLENLTLSSNQLTFLPERSFYNMPKMIKLTLYKNPLLSLPVELMGHMPEMPEFLLYETNLTTVPGNLFANMTGLEVLKFHFNDKLSELPPDLFCCLPELHELSLKSNNLQRLLPQHFSRLNKLETLLLNNNTLNNLPNNIFQDLGQLTILDLRGNQLKILPEDIFKSNALQEIGLSDNPWDCTCSIRGFVRWVRQNMQVVLDSQNVMCHSPRYQMLRTLDSLRDEELNTCSITTVTPSWTPTQEPTQESSTTTASTEATYSQEPQTSLKPDETSTKHELSSYKPQISVRPDETSFTYDISPTFHDVLIVEQGPEYVHHNYHNGWVYVWFLPSNPALAGFLTFSHIMLVATGIIVILLTMYSMHLLTKRVKEIKAQFVHIEG